MTVEIKNIWYNPSSSAFEGRIDVKRDGKSFRYPCAVEGPLNMSTSEVRQRMTSQALQMSDTPPIVFSIR